MSLVLTAAHKGGDHTLPHDLNFQKTRYEATHVVVSMRVYVKPDFLAMLSQRCLHGEMGLLF